MMSPAELLLRKHARREFRQRMQAGELKACIVPVAAVEQHLEHLAWSTTGAVPSTSPPRSRSADYRACRD